MILKKFSKTTLLLGFSLALTACVSHSNSYSNMSQSGKMQKQINLPALLSDVSLKEKLYTSTRSYEKLINLYRGVLKVLPHNDTATRNLYLYKLSQAYFDKGDNKSAILYSQPLLLVPSYKQKAMSLKLKALIQAGNYREGLDVANELIRLNPNMADTYNSQGIAYAELGQTTQAEKSFNKARSYFLDDQIAINNLAMLDIVRGRYKNAVRLLLPLYLSNNKDQRVVYNLVFALIKSGDSRYALEIIKKEGLNTNGATLVNALEDTQRISRHITSRH